ncbi:MAG: nuclear transport factor 2 family protein [Candidatus Acidiferrales bacterium]
MSNSGLKRAWWLVIGVLVLTVAGPGAVRIARASQDGSAEAAKAEVLKTDEEFNVALRTQNRAMLERLIADDVSWVARGDRLDKARVISDVMSKNLHFRSLTHDSIQVKLFGNTAVVTGHSTSVLEYKGKLYPTPRLFTSVYMKLDGRWQLVAHQVSTLTNEKK